MMSDMKSHEFGWYVPLLHWCRCYDFKDTGTASQLGAGRKVCLPYTGMCAVIQLSVTAVTVN